MYRFSRCRDNTFDELQWNVARKMEIKVYLTRKISHCQADVRGISGRENFVVKEQNIGIYYILRHSNDPIWQITTV